MRHIAIHTFQPSAAWQAKATKATTELLAKPTPQERIAYIKAHDDIWKELGAEFIAHFGSKCWYTDAANYGARLDVEHLRPKAKVIELTIDDCSEATNALLLQLADVQREGYWWLAFNAENLLLCAQVMNREDKRNFFPLHRDSPVANGSTGAKQNLWRTEIPVFLDPRKLTDVCLVTYDENGAMRPTADLQGWDKLRVIVTNECFGLSRFQPLVEGRQHVWQRCSSLVERYVHAAKQQIEEQVPNPVLEQQKNDLLIEIQGMLDPAEPFCSVVAACLQASPFGWAKSLATQSVPRRQPKVAQSANAI